MAIELTEKQRCFAVIDIRTHFVQLICTTRCNQEGYNSIKHSRCRRCGSAVFSVRFDPLDNFANSKRSDFLTSAAQTVTRAASHCQLLEVFPAGQLVTALSSCRICSTQAPTTRGLEPFPLQAVGMKIVSVHNAVRSLIGVTPPVDTTYGFHHEGTPLTLIPDMAG